MPEREFWPLIEDRAILAAVRAWGGLSGDRAARLRELTRDVRQRVVEGLSERGVVRLRLIEEPDRLHLDDTEALLLAISRSLGALLPQSRANEVLALIQDQGADYHSPHTRGHQTNAELAFHSDRCDLNVILYVRTAAEGGELSLVSYSDAGDALIARDQSSFALLLDNFPFDGRDDRIFEDRPWYLRPILWRSSAGLRGHYIRRFIADSVRHSDCPRLSEPQQTALDAFDASIEELRAPRTYRPQPGELLLMDSYRVMHARRSFTNIPAGPGRLAMRTWVASFASEQLPEFMLPLTGAVAAGAFRGGAGSGVEYLASLGRPAQTVATQWPA